MINLKYARRQAYRYGRTLGQLSDQQSDIRPHLTAWMRFLDQFSNLEDCATVQKYLTDSFDIGVEGDSTTDKAYSYVL